mmetsp:Transcript_43609/g.70822  ORF Transcript_43609/g.70822 Transcript_43609/m.70822 type:complete len:225 (-) Transcript_43609:285-959(-)
MESFFAYPNRTRIETAILTVSKGFSSMLASCSILTLSEHATKTSYKSRSSSSPVMPRFITNDCKVGTIIMSVFAIGTSRYMSPLRKSCRTLSRSNSPQSRGPLRAKLSKIDCSSSVHLLNSSDWMSKAGLTTHQYKMTKFEEGSVGRASRMTSFLFRASQLYLLSYIVENGDKFISAHSCQCKNICCGKIWKRVKCALFFQKLIKKINVVGKRSNAHSFAHNVL